MGMRAVSSGAISFGLVAIPAKLYSATKNESAAFSLITPKGNKVKQQYVDAVTQELVEYADLQKGFEVSKGQYVIFTKDEIKALEPSNSGMEILEFVPFNSVDFIHVEKSYYVGVDKGGDKAFRLLLEAMKQTEMVAIGRYTARSKQHLIMIRPYKDGMILHHLFYANEVREYNSNCANVEFSEDEIEMATQLINNLASDEFDPSQYRDEFSEKIKEVAQQKADGKEVTITSESPQKNASDVFAALKASLESSPKKKKTSKKKTSSKKKASRKKVANG